MHHRWPYALLLAFASVVAAAACTARADDASPVRALTRFHGEAAWKRWSPDGSRIAFWMNVFGGMQIGAVSAGGGEVGTLTDVGESPFAPTWAPDGRSIAYSCYVHPGAETYVRDLRTRARRRLTNTSARSGHAAWSPDGNRIAFVSRPGGRGDIYTVSPDGTDMRRVTRDVGTVRFPAWFRWREDRVLSHDPRNRADMDRERRRTGRIRCGAVGRRWRLRPDMVAGRTMDRVQPTGSKRREPVRDLCRRRSGRPSDGQRLSRRVPVVVAGRP
ncbi:hypothetical protein HN371_04390 [Candidatus Poribacteria bacterium]|nr:hypothetical protein [Candidatus Poribacteria bacterium]MBT5532336.1 hypothetical protein [Candidatus Poribacteria bacterium]MBT7096831.1 hypothetical protein [Candidatus Poribacteria bacterium]MBT7804032.1 hypothetical protein [Candidatus Poribacteria bacterium]